MSMFLHSLCFGSCPEFLCYAGTVKEKETLSSPSCFWSWCLITATETKMLRVECETVSEILLTAGDRTTKERRQSKET